MTKLNLDFIVVLLMTIDENSAIMSITNRFFKYIKTISKKETFFVVRWKKLYWKFVFKNWRIFVKLINDKNSKFNFDFWRTMFQQQKIALNIITTYYSSINEQAKKFNQTIEIVFRYLLINYYEKRWDEFLFYIEYVLNVFSNVSTQISSFEILYDVKSKIFSINIVFKNQDRNKRNFLKKKTTNTIERNWCNKIDSDQNNYSIWQKTSII